MSCSSVNARPPATEISCRTTTNTSSPLCPRFGATDTMRDLRVAVAPTASGRCHSIRLPAHIRRGSGTGGRKPPRFACPSGPTSDWRYAGRKYSQCQSGGTASPARGAASSRSSVADRSTSGRASIVSSLVSLFPTHTLSVSLSSCVIASKLLLPRSCCLASHRLRARARTVSSTQREEPQHGEHHDCDEGKRQSIHALPTRDIDQRARCKRRHAHHCESDQ